MAFAFSTVGLRIDFITVEILRRWLRTLSVAGFSYRVPGAPSLTLWKTAAISESPVGEPLTITRPRLADAGEQIIAAIPENL